MPLASEDPCYPTNNKQEPVAIQATPPSYHGVTVDTRYIPSSQIIVHIEGSSWIVNYYSQILNRDNAVAGQNIDRPAIYAAYNLVERFEFRVSRPLDALQDSVGMNMQVTGAANVYTVITPNVGDMFLADIGDGREGVFRVTKSERKSIFKDTAHQIEYVLADYSTAERRADFASKVINRYVFNKDFLLHGQNPLILYKEFVQAESLLARSEELIEYYFRKFTSTEFRTLQVPHQAHPTYDPFVTKAVTRMFNTSEAIELISLRVLNCDGDNKLTHPTIWDVLISKNKTLLKTCTKRIGLTFSRAFPFNPMFETIRHSGFIYVVYPNYNPNPLLYNYVADNVFFNSDKPIAAQILQNAPSDIRQLKNIINETALNGFEDTELPLLPDPINDGHYIFTEAFYLSSCPQSQLEHAVLNYLDDKPVDVFLLLRLCETYFAWNELEQFYFIPIVIMLIRATVRRM